MKNIILASNSPRRKELLKKLLSRFNMDFISINANIDESLNIKDPKILVSTLSKEKALYILNNTNKKDNLFIIGCDTVVFKNNEILTKPLDFYDAKRQLLILNNSTHNVYTGLCVLGYKNGIYFEEISFVDSLVTFNNFTINEIEDYIATKEPNDKAGSYAIQGIGSFLVKKIDGDFYSIMGLPINKVYSLLKKYNFLCKLT